MHERLLRRDAIRTLAPEALPSRRSVRYGGDGMGVRLADLDAVDVAIVRRLYQALSSLLGDLRIALRLPAGDGTAPGGFDDGTPDVREPDRSDLDAALDVLLRVHRSADWQSIVDDSRTIGHSDPGYRPRVASMHVRQALHDIRGGALQALVLSLAFLDGADTAAVDILRPFYLTRDHLKIMRNALEDIDAPARARDTRRREHDIALLAEKWAGAIHPLPGRAATVQLFVDYDGPISERCIEFSALDRVLYNLMNNAVRFTRDGTVQLYITRTGENVRFVVANPIKAAHSDALTSRFGPDASALFNGGFTDGGEGLGLSICAEFVVQAFGLEDIGEATRSRYLGARVDDALFVAWFHWPAIG